MWVVQTDPEKRTALHYAVAYKHQSIFAELLASGADYMAEVTPPPLLSSKAQHYHARARMPPGCHGVWLLSWPPAFPAS